ncbi:hypothetical protein IJ579_03805 [bacterium]|nr:hypothetical protein [bacterium]
MMKVGFNPVVTFKAEEQVNQAPKRKGRVVLPDVSADFDGFKTHKHKKNFKEHIADFWKFFSVMGTMTGAVVKGAVYGLMSAIAVMGVFWPFKALPKAFAKEGPTLGNVISKPFKYIGTAGKALSVAAALAVFGYHVIAGKLNANQNTAIIDHKLNIGHRDLHKN